MKYFILLFALGLGACGRPESFYSKNCIYNSWKDGEKHCDRYNLVAAPKTRTIYYPGKYGWYAVRR